jgi:hypothetical protein
VTAFPYIRGEGVSKFVGGLPGHNLAAKGGIEGCLSGRLVRPGRASTAFFLSTRRNLRISRILRIFVKRFSLCGELKYVHHQ